MKYSRSLFFGIALLAFILPQLASADNTSVPRPEGLTDLTSPNGTVVSDADLLNGMSPQLAFNDSTSTTDTSKRCITNNKKTLALVYTFDSKTLVNAIGIQNFNNGDCQTRSPKAWTFWGSDDFDGTRAGIATATWTKIEDATKTNETGWGKPEYRFYQFANTKSYKSYKIAFTDTNGNSYLQFQKLEYFCVLERCVKIHGDPAPCGDFSYDTVFPEAGATVVMTAFDGTWTNTAQNVSAVCLGYEAVTPDPVGGTNMVLASGSGTTCSFTMPDSVVDLTWKFERSFKIELSAGANGSVVGPTEWVKEGSVVSPTVTPEDGYGFFKWDTSDASLCRFDTALYAKKPIVMTAIFAPVVTLEEGENKINDALAEATDDPLILRLAAGTYKETTETANCVTLDKPVHIEGLGASPSDVTITRDTAKIASARIFKLDNADAVVRNVTISGGYGQTNKEPVQGGNVYMTENGGTLLDAIVTDGYLNTYNSIGGNIMMYGGCVVRCIVQNGSVGTGYGTTGGAGINATGSSLIENSVIRGNVIRGSAANNPAGVSLRGNSLMVNCTLVENGTTVGAVGAVNTADSSQVINCAIFNNKAKDDGTGYNQTWGGDSSAYVNCYADVLINGKCFQTENPAFTDAPNGDYTLSVSSPLRDVGANYLQTGAMSASDLVGINRMSGASVDIGAYEYVASGMSCDFTANSNGGLTPAPVMFTATAEGGSGSLSYSWDFDGDGVIDVVTADASYTYTYTTAGVFSVSLKVSDGTLTAESEHKNMIKTCQKTLYVATEGTGEFPYTNLTTAATTITAAVDAAVDGCEIFIAAGDYPITQQIVVNKSLRILGLGTSPTDVYVYSGSERAFRMDNADAFIANIAMKGTSVASGKTLLIENAGGMVSNCVIYVGDGLGNWGAGGAAVSGTKAYVTHCEIFGAGNASLGDGWMRGGAVHFYSKSRIENTLIRDCSITYDLGNSLNGGNTISLNGGSVAINCTVVNCTNSTETSGGIYLDATSYATNCVAFDIRNAAGNGANTWLAGTDANFVNCTSTNITAAAFKDYANGDYTPQTLGGLYNKGAAVANPPATDLAGKPRVLGKAIDIGCYEGNLTGIVIMFK